MDRLEEGSFEALAAGFAATFGVPEVAAADLRGRRSSYMLVDVRTPAEQAVSRIPGAVLAGEADPASFPEVQAALRDGRSLVLYCTGGYRSARTAASLRERGVSALNLHGGIIAYANGGGELVNDSGLTNRVHGYNSIFARYVKPPNIGVADPPVASDKAP